MTRRALVTGAASGIGQATAIGLAREGYALTLLVRDTARGEAAQAAVRRAVPHAQTEALVADLSSQRSIRDAARRFLAAHDRLDVLVNCAGVFMPERVVTEDDLEATFAINVMAYYLLTTGLLPALRNAAPARVVNVASKYGRTRIDFDDLQTAQKYSYLRATPPTMLARVLLTQAFAERLAPHRITVTAVHPGLVAGTRLLNGVGGFFRWMTNRFGQSPEAGAESVVWLATAPEAAEFSGRLVHKRRPIATPGQGSDPDARRRLWAACEALVKAQD